MEHPVQQRITRFRRQLRRLVLLHGLSCTLAVGLAAMLALGWMDYLLRLHDRGLRVMISLGMVTAWGWACYRYLTSTWRLPVDDVHLALSIQRQFPELGGRLASAIEFLRQRDDDATAGSPSLRRAVIAETAALIEPLDFSAMLNPRPAYQALAAMIMVALLVAVLAVTVPTTTRVAISRLLNPLNNTAWPRTTHLALRKTVTQVGHSQAFEVEAFDARGAALPAVVRIHYRFQHLDGTMSIETRTMRALDDVRVARRENVVRPFDYRIEGGDDHEMDWISVAVLDPPAVASLSIRAIPPSYTGWPPYEASQEMRVLAGTRLEFSGRATKPLDSAVLCFEDGRRIPAMLKGNLDFRVSISTAAPQMLEKPFSYWFSLTDREGLTVDVAQRGEIHLIADSPPTVSLEQPSATVWVTPQAMLPIRVAVKDDLSVHQVELILTRSDQPQAEPAPVVIYHGSDCPVLPANPHHPAEMHSGESRTIDYTWDLNTLDLRPGIELTLQAQACDYQPQPNTGDSESWLIQVITPEELQNRLDARQSQVLAELQQALTMQQESRQQVEALATQMARSVHLAQSDVDHLQATALTQRQVDCLLTSSTEGVPRHLREILTELDNNRMDSADFRHHLTLISAEIGRLEKDHLPDIMRSLTAAMKEVPLDQQMIASHLTKASVHQRQVIEAIQQLLAWLRQGDRRRRFHQEIGQLLHRQEDVAQRTAALGRQTLAQKLKDLSSPQQADLRTLEQQQLDLARQLGQLQEEMSKAAGQANDSQAVERLAAAVAEIQQRAIVGQMRAVEEQIQANRMGQAVKGQKKVTNDLQEVMAVLAGEKEQEAAQQPQKQAHSNPQQTQEKKVPQAASAASSQPGMATNSDKLSAQGRGNHEPLEPGQVHDIQRQLWGELPEKSREQLLQLPIEEFLPSYAPMIEDYYRRLIDEKGKP